MSFDGTVSSGLTDWSGSWSLSGLRVVMVNALLRLTLSANLTLTQGYLQVFSLGLGLLSALDK